MSPIYAITGPPGAGKSTLCRALLARFEFGLHLEVDQLRLWVTQGLSDSVPWTDETERQFQIAEAAACAVARTYANQGFAVALDHCRNLPRWNQFLDNELAGWEVRRILLLPSLEVNLHRNRTRTNKDFDPAILDPVIEGMFDHYNGANTEGWLTLDTTSLSVEETINAILATST